MKLQYPPFRLSRLIVTFLFLAGGVGMVWVERGILTVLLDFGEPELAAVRLFSLIGYVGGWVLSQWWKSTRDSAIWEMGEIECEMLLAKLQQRLNKGKPQRRLPE